MNSVRTTEGERLRSRLIDALKAGNQYNGDKNHEIITSVERLCRLRCETDDGIHRILDVLGDEASDDCGALLRIERAVRRLKAERDRLREKVAPNVPHVEIRETKPTWCDVFVDGRLRGQIVLLSSVYRVTLWKDSKTMALSAGYATLELAKDAVLKHYSEDEFDDFTEI